MLQILDLGQRTRHFVLALVIHIGQGLKIVHRGNAFCDGPDSIISSDARGKARAAKAGTVAACEHTESRC